LDYGVKTTLGDFLSKLEKELPTEKTRRDIFSRAVRTVKSRFKNELNEDGKDVTDPHPASVDIVNELIERVGSHKQFFEREAEENFKKAYLMVQAMCANWTKKVQAIGPQDQELYDSVHEQEPSE
jgi:hypothetical protein